ncbi:MAG: hypothetical protein KGJ82_03620 [Nitrospirota bacterium]|nr:hypothetical protein [Nitrospirota bacterium]
MIDPQPAKKAKRYYTKHGLTTLKKAMRVLGGRAIDRRTAMGRALEDWRHSIIQDLGGVDQTSTQQRQVIDLAVKTKLILDSIDAYLFKQPSLVNHRRRMLLPVVTQRQTIADGLARYMTQLGLEKKVKQLPSLSDYLANKAKNGPSDSQAMTKPEPQATGPDEEQRHSTRRRRGGAACSRTMTSTD